MFMTICYRVNAVVNSDYYISPESLRLMDRAVSSEIIEIIMFTNHG